MAKKSNTQSTKSLKKNASFSRREFSLYMLIFAVVGAFTLWISFAAPVSSGSCSILPGQVVLDQIWTVSASGLPKSNVNMILTFPNGAQSTGPIKVGSDGTFTTTGNSNMSKDWGFIAPEQTGTYKYQFVGKLKWPAGSFNQTYATCSVQVM